MTESYDVAIIGAGIHGVSAAYHLAGDATCVVLEKDFPASGPTGRSSAVCRAYYTNPFLAEVARDAMKFLAAFEEMTDGGSAGFHASGGLFMHAPEDAAEVTIVAERLNAIGTKVEMLDVDELAQRVPSFDLEGVGVGVWEADAGYADPAATTNAMYDECRRRGVATKTRTPVIGIEESRNGVDVVTASGERISCGRLLIAAGPWTAPLARLAGAELPLTVERHWVVTCGWESATPFPFVFADIPGGYYCKPEGRDLFCLGPLTEEPLADPDAFDESITDDEAERMLTAVSRRAPELDDASVRGGWASLYDVSPDWQPVIGAISDRVFVDAGTSGHGFKLAPVLGRHVASLLLGQTVDDRIEQFAPDRFARGATVESGYRNAKILG